MTFVPPSLSPVFPSSDPGAEKKWAQTSIYSGDRYFCLYFAGFVLPAFVFFEGLVYDGCIIL